MAARTEYTRHAAEPAGWRAYRDGGAESIRYHDSIVTVI